MNVCNMSLLRVRKRTRPPSPSPSHYILHNGTMRIQRLSSLNKLCVIVMDSFALSVLFSPHVGGSVCSG